MFGTEKGETCNRGGCTGIIDEEEQDGGCTCFLGNPPCSYCTTDTSYCPVCGWEAEYANNIQHKSFNQLNDEFIESIKAQGK